jgi:hypothetical protein
VSKEQKTEEKAVATVAQPVAAIAKPGSFIPGGFIDAFGRQVILNADIVRKSICATATDGELTMFLYACKTLTLNPFAHEIYLIKYENQPAYWTVDYKEYMKRAGRNRHYLYYKLEIVMDDKGIFPVEGTCKVYRDDRKAIVYDENHVPLRDERGGLVWDTVPIETTVLFREWAKFDKDHQGDNNFLQATWKVSPRAQFEKTLIKRGFIFAFPEEEWAQLGMEDGDVQGMMVEGEVSDPAPQTKTILNAKTGVKTEVDTVTGEIHTEDRMSENSVKLLGAWGEQWNWSQNDLLAKLQEVQPGCVDLLDLTETNAKRLIKLAQDAWTQFDGKIDKDGYPVQQA